MRHVNEYPTGGALRGATLTSSNGCRRVFNLSCGRWTSVKVFHCHGASVCGHVKGVACVNASTTKSRLKKICYKLCCILWGGRRNTIQLPARVVDVAAVVVVGG